DGRRSLPPALGPATRLPRSGRRARQSRSDRSRPARARRPARHRHPDPRDRDLAESPAAADRAGRARDPPPDGPRRRGRGMTTVFLPALGALVVLFFDAVAGRAPSGPQAPRHSALSGIRLGVIAVLSLAS